MKHLAILIMLITPLSMTWANAAAPTVARKAPSFHETVLLIKSKHHLKIPKNQQLALDKELGEVQRNQFYMAMVMQKSVLEIMSQYQASNRPITKQIIEKYKIIMDGHTKVSLN